MPGFNECYTHNSVFNRRLSEREIRKRNLQKYCYYYLENIGINPLYIKYTLRGNKLSFYYNAGNATFKHIVNLDTKEYKNVQLRTNRKCDIIYDTNTNSFLLRS